MEAMTRSDTRALCLYPKCVKKRAKTLQISETELRGIDLLEFRNLVRKRFKEEIRKYHPDTRPPCYSAYYKTRYLTKATAKFTYAIKAYKFLMRLTENDLRIMKQNEKPLPYFSMPWHYEKKVRLGLGFQEMVVRN